MRLIDATALIVDLKRQYDEVFGKAKKTVNPKDFFIERQSAYIAHVIEAEQNGFFKYLKARPTVDAVPVIRCKDCDNRVYIDMGAEIGVVGGCAIYKAALPEDFYCAYGKREVIE